VKIVNTGKQNEEEKNEKNIIMKKYILIILASAIATVVSAQVTKSDTAKKVYKNEFGIDATGFIKQFLNF